TETKMQDSRQIDVRRAPRIAWLALAMLWLPTVAAWADDPIKRLEERSSEAGSVPVWSQPSDEAVASLSQRARNIKASIFIIGHPKHGYGTGFVISQEHRLLATNAHVADIMHAAGGHMLAIGNGSDDVYKIKQAWHHPGVVRESEFGEYLRSQHPSAGAVFARSADVAVLEVDGDEELPPALELATPAQVFDLFALPVGMIGFPGHDTEQWPGVGESAAATFRQGVISRVTDFFNDAGVSVNDRQFLQHSMLSWGGFSGSPIFLPDGRVVGLHNSGRSVTSGDRSVSLAYGVRADCLWELLAYHQLDTKLPIPVNRDDLRLTRFEGEDPRLAQFAQAVGHVTRGRLLTAAGKHAEAGRAFKEALALAPNYGLAHTYKAANHNSYVIRNQNRASAETLLKQWALEVEHREKAYLLNPNDPLLLARLVNAQVGLAGAQNPSAAHPDLRPICLRIIETPGVSDDARAQAYIALAGTYWYARERVPFATAAIELTPFTAIFYESRASMYRVTGQSSAASADAQRAADLRQAYGDSMLAWQLATARDENYRDGDEAVRLATSACRTTNYRYWPYLDTLAAAYAEAGNFEEAIRQANRAYELAPEGQKSDVAARRRVYQEGRPYRG
ncbi:MAG: hypothetical protein DWQ35_07095, partial [Planctomycetota bacterium]